MPGIAGIITRMPRAVAERQLHCMVESLRHEPFYRSGTVVDEALGVYAGWTVQKETFADRMPICSAEHKVSIVFSGEDYTATAEGSDLGYLIDSYVQDRDFPAQLNGMFHGVVIDRLRRAVTLFNDRFGMHRLYYYAAKDAFYFAAEAKALVAVRDEVRKMDPRGMGEFIAMSCVLEDRTIFQNVQAMPAGSKWQFQNGELKKDIYFSPRQWEVQPALPREPYYHHLRSVFAKLLPRYFTGRQRIGMALTGGLDTRLLMAWQKVACGTMPCYTFGGMYRECQDVRIARRVANLCGQTHRVITVGDFFLQRFPEYAERSIFLTEGGVDAYRASDLYVSEMAREIAPVKLVGTYGSEIVRGAVMFKPTSPLPGLFTPEVLAEVQLARQTYTNVRRGHPVTFAAFRQSPWYHHGILALEQTQLTVRSPFMDNDFVQAVYRSSANANDPDDVRLRLIANGRPPLADLPSDRGVGGNANKLTRSFSRLLQEFTFKAEYAYDYGMPQWVSRTDHLVRKCHLEKLFLGRHKFLHFRVWYKGALAPYVREMLLDSVTLSRPYLNRKAVEAVVEGHTRGGFNYTSTIHKLLTLEILQRRFFDRPWH